MIELAQYEIAATQLVTTDSTIPLDGRTVYLDLCGAVLGQRVLDIVTSAAGRDSRQPVNIILRRIAAIGGVPRMIVDRDAIYDAVVLLLRERERVDRSDSGMAEDERGTVYTEGEAMRVADTYPDEYVRQLVQFLLRRIERLRKDLPR